MGADATFISPEEHADTSESNSDESDSGSEAAELSIEPEWETSFAHFLIAERNCNLGAESRHSQVSSDFETNLSTEDLTVLLELVDDGLPVTWPQGLDARVARIILANRRSST